MMGIDATNVYVCNLVGLNFMLLPFHFYQSMARE